MPDSVRPHRRQPTRLPCPWDSPGKNTGVGCHFLLRCVKVKSLSRVQRLATPLPAAYQAAPPMGFSKQEYWSGVPLPSPFPQVGILLMWCLIIEMVKIRSYYYFLITLFLLVIFFELCLPLAKIIASQSSWLNAYWEKARVRGDFSPISAWWLLIFMATGIPGSQVSIFNTNNG